jgi:hypothetical protein
VISDERPVSQLDLLTAEFPAFAISLEPTAGGIRFVARNRHDGVHPRLVITRDATELRAALSVGTT